MSKSRLSELNTQLGVIFAEIQTLSEENKDLLINDGQWVESLGICVEAFDKKLHSFRSKLNKYIDKMPSTRRKLFRDGSF